MQRMPDDLHKRVKKVAKEKGMTVTGMINMLLTEYVDGESEIDVIKKRLEVVEKDIEALKQTKRK
jgi:antitoxin component of RelBE/YafQ-DinJ toxin-antitoxin module